MKGSIRSKGKTWSYRVYVSTVDGQNKQIENIMKEAEVKNHHSFIFTYRTTQNIRIWYKYIWFAFFQEHHQQHRLVQPT